MTDEAQAEVLPVVNVDELVRLSQSQLSTFRQCGEQYRLQSIEHAPQTAAAWYADGRAFHSAVEAYELSGRTMTAPEVAAIAVHRYDFEISEMLQECPDVEQWRRGDPRTKTKVDIERRRDRVGKWAAEYVMWAPLQPWSIWESPEGLAIELEFEILFSGCRVVGRIDQIIRWPDGTLEVVDLKTGSKRPKSVDQLGIYALALEGKFGEELRPPLGHYYMAKDTTTTAPVDLSGYTFRKIEVWFNNLAKARALSLFIPKIEEDNCRPCGVRAFCGAIDGEMAELYDPDPDIRASALAAFEAAQLVEEHS